MIIQNDLSRFQTLSLKILDSKLLNQKSSTKKVTQAPINNEVFCLEMVLVRPIVWIQKVRLSLHQTEFLVQNILRENSMQIIAVSNFQADFLLEKVNFHLFSLSKAKSEGIPLVDSSERCCLAWIVSDSILRNLRSDRTVSAGTFKILFAGIVTARPTDSRFWTKISFHHFVCVRCAPILIMNFIT